MFLGYNTNGLAHHDLFDAVELLSEIGYRGVAITIDHNALPPNDPHHTRQIERLQRLLKRHGMRSMIETGARFLLDPRIKHEPTLLSEAPDAHRRRIDFYKYAIDCAAALGSDGVSIWSGAGGTGPFFGQKTISAEKTSAENTDPSPFNPSPTTSLPQAGEGSADMMDRLVAGLRETLDYAAAKNVTIGFEPEPGMLIDTLAAFGKLLERIDSPNLGLTLDVGHLHCQGETPIADAIFRWASRLVNVHIEDMRRGKHEHLMFGEGEIEFPPVLRALAESGYAGGVYVELSRHSHEGPEAARRAFDFLASIPCSAWEPKRSKHAKYSKRETS
jgi:L-ribulose-5-phosphate 3-epimerase